MKKKFAKKVDELFEIVSFFILGLVERLGEVRLGC
jgi:hypothetical protein